MCVAWNPIFKKLTTSDESGLIIVWMLHKGKRRLTIVHTRRWLNVHMLAAWSH